MGNHKLKTDRTCPYCDGEVWDDDDGFWCMGQRCNYGGSYNPDEEEYDDEYAAE